MAFDNLVQPNYSPEQAGGNALAALSNIYKAQNQQLQNQYYGPSMEADINNKNSLTQGQNIENQYMPEKLKLANAFAQLQNQYYGPKTQAEINQQNALTNKYNTMTPLEARELEIKNQFGVQREQADIAEKNAMGQYYLQGGASAGVDQKNFNAFVNQIAMDNNVDPQTANKMASAYLSGESTTADGKPVPPMSGAAADKLTKIQNKNAPVAVRNQAANYDVLTNDLKAFDIDAVKAFAGPLGRAKLAYAKANMVLNPNDPNIDPMARRFLSSMNQAIINMDSMRKAFGTSVVPGYVYNTIGRLTNPSDPMWNDATQVAQNYNDVVNTVSKNRDMWVNKAKHGVTSSLPENGSDKSNNNASNTPKLVIVQSPDGSQQAQGTEEQAAALLKDNPTWKRLP